MGEDTRGGERRKHGRVPAILGIVCEFIGREKMAGDSAGDISIGGVRVYFEKMVMAGDRLKLTISVEDRTIEATAVVRWIRSAQELDPESKHKYAVGLEFMDIGEGYASILSKLIEDKELRRKE